MNENFHKINLKTDRPIINILGEICWGLEIEGFEKKIGVKQEIVEALANRLISEEKNGVIETFLSDFEVGIVNKSLNEIKNQLEECEIDIRFGLPIEEVEKIPLISNE